MNISNPTSVKNIPGPSGFPVVGVIPKLQQDPLKFFLEAAIEYGDPARLELGPKTAFLVSDPDTVQHVLQSNNRNYRKGYDEAKPLMGEGLVTSEGDFWLQQRRLIQPAFNRGQINEYTPYMEEATEEMLSDWENASAQGKSLDIAHEMMRLTQKIILRTMFSTDIGDEAQEISVAFDQTLEYLNRVLFTPFEFLLHLPTPSNIRHKQALKRLDQFVYGLIEQRRKSKAHKGDLLDKLLHAGESENGMGMDDTQLRDEIMTIFLAGHETTANALAWTWYLLSENPAAEEKLVDEIDRMLGGAPPSFEDLTRLEYTKMVFDETLRLYPPAWMFARETIDEDVLGGFRIPPETMIMLSPYVTHRLPKLWSDPQDFNPDRFSPEETKNRHKFAYFPFGGGPRLCLGNNFAIVEAQLIMSRILQRFRLKLVAGYQIKPTPIATLQPRPGMLMHLEKR